jgi:hypothetical protein
VSAVSRETRRDVAAVLLAFVGLVVVAGAAMYAAAAVAALFLAVPELIPGSVVAARLAVIATAPRPRSGSFDEVGQ